MVSSRPFHGGEIMASSTHLSPIRIRKFFAALPDPRRRRRRIKHPLLNLIVIALCAVIAGADDWQEIVQFGHSRRAWLARLIDLSEGIPSHDTFQRVFATLDPVAFQKCLLAWVQALHEATQGEVIAIDGKVAREAMARAGDQGPLTLVSAWATANHVCLGQVAGDKGSNELAALPKLLDLLDLHGAIVTIDALGCQKHLVQTIVDREGDYVISVKGNQEKLLSAMQTTFASALEDNPKGSGVDSPRTHSKRETGHGRHETRMTMVLEVPEDFPERDQWPGLQSLVMVVRDCEDSKGVKKTGTRYFITSLPARAKRLATVVRTHWRIENELHWVLDVVFREDRNRARAEHSQAILGVLRRTAISLLKNTPELTGSMHCRRKQAGWDNTALENAIFGRQLGKD
jgi:predicted transposase YbfD/YdcC